MWKQKKEVVVTTNRNHFKKKCTKCLKNKDWFDFYVQKKRVDGRGVKCKECISKYANNRTSNIKSGTIKAF